MKDYEKEHKETMRKATDNLFSFFGGSISQTAKSLAISSPTATVWRQNGRVSPKGAISIDLDERIPFTKEYLRPDILTWD